MLHAIITLTDEAEAAIEAIRDSQTGSSSIDAILMLALREYLERLGHVTSDDALAVTLVDERDRPRGNPAERGGRQWIPAEHPLHVTPFHDDCDDPNGSIDHDRILAEKWT